MMGALKNHRDQEVTVSVESLVPADHFLTCRRSHD